MGFARSILHFFIPPERTLLYTTFDQREYFVIKNRLSVAGIRHRSKINGGMRVISSRNHYGGNMSSRHELFVSKEDEHNALKAIQK
ncbi:MULTISPECIES: hypothetical protein [unclassified Paenibacillus]|uniref:hypothetical protein n=1 Tax=unclassified Paenibacillus TaxID=185978 RepID=UPI0024057A46|nr:MULTISPECIES: hypothetical protein [unclassified Paenibacillus]MDF9840456.1 hypothetical protein [Paenibacillus sp. PastF-2]MDF9847038.1 hypothetical protein [Paenibacillus sp. PastM-2]MDF9853610.1 hypothetical protein [Paenibacillus sp. PastF-1]MDH6478904.1 hypothetical protein [Paenibacillus sp. PastH-2]MDH6506636.1 hypothetical protein [Paenibacillus sp. PastM-3]